MTKGRDVEAQGSCGEQREPRTTSRASLLLVGLVGSIAGAAAALLLTPWRGSETRRRLKDAAATAGTGAKDKALALKDKASGILRSRRGEEADSEAPDD